MILVEAVLGNVRDPDWKARVERAAVDSLTLDQWEAQKNRFRKHTDGGLELAVALDRRTHLRDGDVLVWDEAASRMVVAHIHLNDVMVVRLTDALGQPADALVRTCLELGHAIGNQHWPAVVKGTEIYVPLTVDRKVMASVMKTHALPGVTYDFVPGADVIPYLAPHEARRLFGGADATPHSHAADHQH